MCPDKPPSCYPTPTLRESRPERFDRHALKQSASGVQIVADREHVFSATGRQELRGPHAVAKGTRPGSSRTIDYTVESANRLAEELRAIPRQGPGQAEARQAGHGEAARGRAHRPPATRLHHRRGGRGPARARPRPSRRRPSRTTSSAPRARRRSERRTAPGPRPAGQAAGRQRRRSARRRTRPRPPRLRRHQPQSRRRARRRRARRRRPRRSGAAREHFS